MFTQNSWIAFVVGALVAIAASQFFASHPLSERTATVANGWNAFGYAEGSRAFGHADEGNVRAPSGGDFVNGTFIPRGTSPAQIPSHPSEPE